MPIQRGMIMLGSSCATCPQKDPFLKKFKCKRWGDEIPVLVLHKICSVKDHMTKYLPNFIFLKCEMLSLRLHRQRGSYIS